MLIKNFLKTHTYTKLPNFIKSSLIWQNISRIEKPFPEIGLPNCLEPISLEGLEPDDLLLGKLYIGFTSANVAGLWDLATMSMRGVCSCMHWDNMHSTHLVGSITDPFLGMVYITDNKLTKYGISFKRRSLVRFVYDVESKKYKLLLERVYKDTGNTIPTVYNNKDLKQAYFLEVFTKFLKSKVNPIYDVVPFNEFKGKLSYHFIPSSHSARYLSMIYRSMSDCNLGHLNISDDTFIQKFANQI